uniref:CASC1 C-terminal domain-containing protein n=1 Tax=Glossina brevipalpis TaxID=37001 RepID=A0A1A9WF91_9MUSC
MEPKKLKVKVYKVISLKDIKIREQKYVQRIVDTKFLFQFIKEAMRIVQEQDEKQWHLKNWNAYVQCSPFPSPYKTNKLRSFLHQLKFLENAAVMEWIDWSLLYDPNSLLTQNIFEREQAQFAMLQAIKPDIGLDYQKMIDYYLRILKNIESFLTNKKATAGISIENLNDIKVVAESIREEIFEALNRLTYRILCSGELLMKSVDAITAEYGFSCDYFQIHIWTLKSVPIRFSHMDENAKSYKPKIPNIPLENRTNRIEGCIISLRNNMLFLLLFFIFATNNCLLISTSPYLCQESLSQCLLREYLTQIGILERVYREIEGRKETFEKKIAEIDEKIRYTKKITQANLQALKKEKMDLIQAIPKLQRLGNDQYPDIEKVFIEEERKEYESYINTVYNPENLDLEYDEINLRRFAILGGVYQLYYVKKPLHQNIGKLNLTWHSTERKLDVEKDVRISRSYSILPAHSKFRISTITPVNLDRSRSFVSTIDREKYEVNETNSMFVLIFYLPDYLCYWGNPIACHYEEFEESGSVNDDERQPDEQIEPSEIKNRSLIFQDELELSKLSKLQINREKARRVSPAEDILDDKGTCSVLQVPNAHQIDVIVKDFPLDFPFTADQAHKITEYSMPQILPSYKFPIEIREDKLGKELAKKRKKQGFMIRIKTEHTDQSHRTFHFDKRQNNPERIYAIYEKMDPLKITGHIEKFTGILPHEPKTFYQLIKTLILIKRLFQYRIYQIFSLKPFVPKIDLEAHRSRVRERMMQEEKNRFKQITLRLNNRISQFKAERRERQSFKLNSRRQTQLTGTSPSMSFNLENKTASNLTTSFLKETSSEKETKKLKMSSHWTARYIRSSQFIREERKFVIETDRLGLFGFACKRYQHFPFKYWSLEPSETGTLSKA